MNWLKTCAAIGTVCGALIAFAGAWHLLGGDTPAWSSDIHKLSRSQAEQAIDVYSKAMRDDRILREQVQNPATRALIDQRLDEYQHKLKAAQDRAIETGK